MFKQELIQKDFFNFRISEFLNILSINVVMIAITWWILQDAPSSLPLVLSLSAGFRILSYALLNFLGDSVPYKKILLITKVINLAFVVLIMIFFSTSKFSIYYVLPILGMSIIEGISMPIVMSIPPKMVAKEQLGSAMRFEGMLQSLSFILGKVMGGAIIGILGILLSFISTVVGFIISIIFCSMTKFPAINNNSTEKWHKKLLNGYTMLIKNPIELGMALTLTLVNFSFTPFILLGIPLLVKDVFHASALYLGILEASIALGIFFGSAFTAKYLSKKFPDDILCTFCIIIAAFCVIMHSIIENVWVSLFCLFILGQAMITFNITSNTKRMLAMPENYRSRLIGCTKLFIEGGIPLGFLALGFLVERFGIKTALFVFGCIPLLTPFILYKIPSYKKLMRSELKDAENFYIKQGYVS
ncbi:MFS transporter [Fluviispira multicolorata]|uniref:MFS transporter n=1 Tax=Fluviispira multicolorata TaxID=2654512 RepID=A0A833JCB0_9BACT|nr:MFS transporter [Fluviispira multicolorata]KAB8030721.1 MFS transporter [Fluviispira multicolorata]